MNEWEQADEELEGRLRRWAIPVALAVCWLLVKTGPGHFLLRTFLSMWIHELGHAVAAWLCGYLAFPGPWLTPVAAQRSLVFELFILGALGYGVFWSIRAEKPVLARAFIAIAAVQLFCSALLSEPRAKQFFIFMGDGGALVIGTLLMLTVYAGSESGIVKGWLRWGFLVIGAASFTDVFEQWWSARHDFDRIPFGMNEGVGLSDPSVLSEQYGWSTDQIVHRYVALGVVCLVVLAGAWIYGLRKRDVTVTSQA